MIHRIHQSLSARASQWITWCRTNSLPLNHFLAIRSPSTSPTCPTCGAEDETLDHFLFPTYIITRESTLHPFLSRKYNPPQPNPLLQLLQDDTGRHNLVQYISATKRFGTPTTSFNFFHLFIYKKVGLYGVHPPINEITFIDSLIDTTPICDCST